MSKKVTDKPLNIILLGDPAAGKATQAAVLVRKFKVYDFDMGKELSKRRNKNSELNLKLQQNTDKGKLTPTAIVREILRQTVISVPQSRGILFDGHPKMLGEAKLVSRLLESQHRSKPVVIYLSIPLEETVKRMRDRKGYFKGKFGKRADDTDKALRNRVKYYRHNIAQVVEFFGSKYKFEKINGLGTVKEVQERIDKALENFME
jgi:adenylate kinase